MDQSINDSVGGALSNPQAGRSCTNEKHSYQQPLIPNSGVDDQQRQQQECPVL